MPEAAELQRFVRGLRAVRRFAQRPIPDDVLDNILETARWTASSKNTQPWHVVLARDPACLADLSTCGDFAGHIKGANAAIALVMKSRGNAFDAGRLAHNIMLGAWAHGVASCIGYFYPDAQEARAKEFLAVPTDRWVPLAISLGYPADENARWLSREPSRSGVTPGRMPMDEFASRERFGS